MTAGELARSPAARPPVTRASLVAGIAAALALAIVVAVGINLNRSFRDFVANSEELDRARAEAAGIELLLGWVATLETSQRGFVITGQPASLAAYPTAVAESEGLLASLGALHGPDVSGDLERLAHFVRAKQAFSDTVIAARRDQGYEPAAALVRTGRGQALTDSARATGRRLAAASNARMRRQSDASRISLGRTRRDALLGVGSAILLGALAGVISLRAVGALRKSMEEAAAANRAKSEFLARMSHELRTPLNSIIGFANILRRNGDGTLSGRQLDHIERVQRNGVHLLGLINDILDLSKVEAREMQSVLESVRLDLLVREVVTQLEPQVAGKPVRLAVQTPDAVEPIITDRTRMQQILTNLVGNAIKFTERGSVTVAIEADEETRQPLRIVVADTGIGIEPERLASIFRPFEQAEATTSRRYGGTGLGLAIAYSFCEMLGCTLDVVSEPGEGSIFTVVLGN